MLRVSKKSVIYVWGSYECQIVKLKQSANTTFIFFLNVNLFLRIFNRIEAIKNLKISLKLNTLHAM